MDNKFTDDNNKIKSYKCISDEKRLQLINLCVQQSLSINEAAVLIGINYKTALTIMNTYKKSSRITKLVKGGSRIKKLTTDILTQVEEIISTKPQSTLKEMKAKLEKSNNVTL